MKLLFDQNLSDRLAARLSDLFPESAHVKQFSLERADDDVVWDFAKAHGYTIVSKDDDFHQMSFLRGHPPKVIWLRTANCSTEELEAILRRHADGFPAFETDPDACFLAVSR